MDPIVEKLRQYPSPTPSKWREEAQWRIDNKKWLRFSQMIAIRVMDRMEELNLSQRKVAEMLGCSQQYVCKLLKGNENLSLETICKLDESLSLGILPKL